MFFSSPARSRLLSNPLGLFHLTSQIRPSGSIVTQCVIWFSLLNPSPVPSLFFLSSFFFLEPFSSFFPDTFSEISCTWMGCGPARWIVLCRGGRESFGPFLVVSSLSAPVLPLQSLSSFRIFFLIEWLWRCLDDELPFFSSFSAPLGRCCLLLFFPSWMS